MKLATPTVATATVSAREAAAELGVTERTVRRWIDAGLLTAEKRGRSFSIQLVEARAVHERSRSARTATRVSALAELRGRYLEVCERLQRVECELAEERRRNGELAAELRRTAA